MIFILSFAVYGAAGVERPFPNVRFSNSVRYYSLTDGLDSGPVTPRRVMWIIVMVTAPCCVLDVDQNVVRC